MRQLIEMYNEAAQQFEDFAFKHIVPGELKQTPKTLVFKELPRVWTFSEKLLA